MKLRYEWPSDTRMARWLADFYDSPIFFANKGVTGHLCLEQDNPEVDWNPLEFNGTLTLKGQASLEVLQLRGRAISMLDAQYSLIAGIGFRPIYVLKILDVSQNLPLRRARVPFSFLMTDSSLDELQQLASSLKVVTPDVATSVNFGKDIIPTMLVSVKYHLEARIYAGNTLEASLDQEVKVFVSLDADHLPSPGILLPSEFAPVRTQSSSLQSRRPSSFWRRRSSASTESHVLHIDASRPEPFTFHEHSDAAATKTTVTLMYTSGLMDLEQAPASVQGTIQWHIKTVTTITPEPIHGHIQDEPPKNIFQLRSRVGSLRSMKLKWPDWQLREEEGQLRPRWQTSQDLWVTEPTSSGLTPTFKTPYLSHSYYIHLQIGITGAGLSSGITKGIKRNVELEVPVHMRYELGLAPSYTVDHGLPRYSEEMVREEEALQRRGTV